MPGRRKRVRGLEIDDDVIDPLLVLQQPLTRVLQHGLAGHRVGGQRGWTTKRNVRRLRPGPTSAIASSSVLTMTRSTKRLARAAAIVQARSGLPPTEQRFFRASPFEPPRAGISATTLSAPIDRLRRSPPSRVVCIFRSRQIRRFWALLRPNHHQEDDFCLLSVDQFSPWRLKILLPGDAPTVRAGVHPAIPRLDPSEHPLVHALAQGFTVSPEQGPPRRSGRASQLRGTPRLHQAFRPFAGRRRTGRRDLATSPVSA